MGIHMTRWLAASAVVMVLALPGLAVDLSDVSGSAVQGRDPDGRKVVVLFISSDTLFDVGSAVLGNPARATFDGLARVIRENWPAAPVQVRGHTDATGSAAANQTCPKSGLGRPPPIWSPRGSTSHG